MTSTVAQEMSAIERDELDWLLESGVLGRSANATRVLRYICEETAAGRGDRIKEYTIAVEALGRRTDFDPQNDTIVRVTVHTLRKRLQEVYEHGEGATHTVRLVIPPGGYAAHFVTMPARVASTDAPFADTTAPDVGGRDGNSSQQPQLAGAPEASRRSLRVLFTVALVAAVAIAALLRHNYVVRNASASRTSTPLPLAVTAGSVRALLGNGRHAYTDRSGQVWSPASCDGGTPTSAENIPVGSTEDSYIFQDGVRGMAHCIFHVPKGTYELHLYFAEPSDLEAATRTATISVNAAPARVVDVVNRAGGDHIATSISIPGISPENDGAIHVDYTSEVSPLNAVEIVPAPSEALLPIRIVASASPFVDEKGQVWLSDRYFSGGRPGQKPDQAHQPNLGLYSADRIGKFQYTLPVVPNASYKVRLYFREPWFGQDNGPAGGPGSRVFNVSCNGQIALGNFDILAEGKGAPVVKTLEHVTATTDGTIELAFLSVVNYPVVNAIEVLPETSPAK